MRMRSLGMLTVVALVAGCGGSEAAVDETASDATQTPAEAEAPAAAAEGGSDTWIEYTVSGDFTAEGRDADMILCSEGDEGQFNVAARGVWFMDMEFQGASAGQHEGSFTVTLPDGLEGSPGDVFARRMKGDGAATVSDAGTGAMGLRLVEVEFSVPELTNDGGQTIGVSGTFRCAVM